MAFKEWEVIIDALRRGDQILILRKGGIHEGKAGFRMEHNRFLLFPTRFHQQQDFVLPGAMGTTRDISPDAATDVVRIDCLAEAAEWRHLLTSAQWQRLRGQHVWRDRVIEDRFEWGMEKGVHAVAVRVWKLRSAVEIPMLPTYGGCKSWVQLDREVNVDGAEPVLPDNAFSEKLVRFRRALESNSSTLVGEVRTVVSGRVVQR